MSFGPASTNRIVVVSRDPAIGGKLATALAGVGGAVELRTVDSLVAADQPALCVIFVDGDAVPAVNELLLRSIGSHPIIAVSPRSSLAAVVEDLLQLSQRVAGVMVAEQFDPARLSSMARRLLEDNVFGLDKLMAPDTQIQSRVVGTYQEKLQCMTGVSGTVEQSGMPRRLREPIEQCVDEMLMNALYDAPVDARGRHIFSGIPTTTRIKMRSEQSVTVDYAYDGKQFGISVRDAFGSLNRSTVLNYLHKCLHADDKIDRKAGGAGVGLYLMVNSASVVHFSVLPGIATEAVCVFGVEASNLEQFGFFVQNNAAGRIATGPSRRVRVTPRFSRTFVGVALAMMAAVAVVGILAWPRLFPGSGTVTFTTIPVGATLQIDGRIVGATTPGTLTVADLEVGRAYTVIARLDAHQTQQAVVTPRDGMNDVTLELQPLATVELDSNPAGASVEIDGKPKGSTPLTLTTLAPGSTVSIVFERKGYRRTTVRFESPRRGAVKRLIQPLELSDDFVQVRFVSNPPGAAIIVTGESVTADRTYAPADVFVEVDKIQRFTLIMPNHAPLVIDPFTPRRGERGLIKGGDLTQQ